MRASYCRHEHPVLLERKDGTLVAWYCWFYAGGDGGVSSLDLTTKRKSYRAAQRSIA
jgi:hypothetical protein